MGTCWEPAALPSVCVTLGCGGDPGGAGKSLAANGAVMESAAPRLPLPMFLGVGSRSPGHFYLMAALSRKGKKGRQRTRGGFK